MANDIQVKIPVSGLRTDSEIAEAAANALRWNFSLADKPVKRVVKAGWVTLSGKVTFGFQRNLAVSALRNLIGVKGVTSDMSFASRMECLLNASSIFHLTSAPLTAGAITTRSAA